MKYLTYSGVLVSILYFNLVSLSYSYAQSVPNEYQVKAAFLYNLIRVTEWPAHIFNSSVSLTLCFMGEDPFGDALDSIKGKTFKDHTISFKKNVSLTEVKQCHLLFISQSEQQNLSTIFSRLDRQPILTVGDMEAFAQSGGMVNLVNQEERIQIEVNLAIVKRAGLDISSRLLTVAKIVESQ